MKKKTNFLLLGMIIIFTWFLASCGTGATPEPTADMAVLNTYAAQTIEVRLTETKLAMPTETPLPTFTPVSFTATASLSNAAAGSTGLLPTANPNAEGLIPTITQVGIVKDPAIPTVTVAGASAAAGAPTSAAAGDKANWTGEQNPADGVVLTPGQSFDIVWYLENTGTTTWTTDYSMRYWTGDQFYKAGKNRYYLTTPVAPGEIGACRIDATAPTTAGTYKMSFVISNDADINFSIVDITIVVG